MNNKPALTEIAHLAATKPARSFHDLLSTIERSRIEVSDLSKAVRSGVLLDIDAGAWANRSTDTDIDQKILAWIASHVRHKRRVKSTMMGISAFLTGLGATLSVAAPSLTNVIDLIA